MLTVTEILKGCGLINVDEPWFTQEARDRGTAVHAATKLLDEDRLDESSLEDPIIIERVDGYRNWMQDRDVEILNREFEVKHEVYGYIGHPDIHAADDRGEMVIDIKPPGYVKWHGYQLAAYQRAISSPWKDGAGAPMRRYILHLGKGLPRGYKFVPHVGAKDWNVFLAAFIVAQAKQK